MRPVEQANLNVEIAARIRRRIVGAQMHEGARINEVQLAAQLGVSRTPLREALHRLVAEGALDAVPRRGFFVRPLTIEELDDIYDIRPILDPEALRLAGIPEAATIARLRALNERFARARSLEKAIDLDDAWHLELVSACPNRVLHELIEQFMRRTRRYEMALLDDPLNVRKAHDAHAAILELLEAGNLRGARRALERNLRHGKEPIKAWLQRRAARTAGS